MLAERAKDKLLKDTNPSPTKTNQRVHEHVDTVNDHNRKFDSLKPKDVFEKDGVSVLYTLCSLKIYQTNCKLCLPDFLN